MRHLNVLLLIAGCLVIAGGVALFDWRAGVITAGLLTALLGFLLTEVND